MARENWDTIKRSKFFYVQTYRRTGSFLIISLAVNIVLILLVYYLYFNQPEPDFYATSGITPPILLKVLNEPNNTSVPLLPPDPVGENEERIIPQ